MAIPNDFKFKMFHDKLVPNFWRPQRCSLKKWTAEVYRENLDILRVRAAALTTAALGLRTALAVCSNTSFASKDFEKI